MPTTSPSTSLDKSKIKILLLEGVHESAVETLRADGYSDIEYHRECRKWKCICIRYCKRNGVDNRSFIG